MIRTRCQGLGAYLPAHAMTNAELSGFVETSDEWIRQRTGIEQRHVVAEGETTSDMATAAARQALADAGMQASDLDAILVATTTPDMTFPATAALVQAKLEARPGIVAFDLQAVCSGFVFGLSVADAMIRAGQVRTVLLIGADAMTKLLEWEDRTVSVLFGDGAGAMILQAAEGQGTTGDRGVLGSKLHTDGRFADHLKVDGGVATTGTVGHLRMNGKEVFRHAVGNMAEVVHEVLDPLGLTIGDIDWLVPHQANQRILAATAQKLGLDPARVASTVAHHGNTSAASIPLALMDLHRAGKVQDDQLLVFDAMGGGFTWGAVAVRWGR